jgi:hypothetical protein
MLALFETMPMIDVRQITVSSSLPVARQRQPSGTVHLFVGCCANRSLLVSRTAWYQAHVGLMIGRGFVGIYVLMTRTPFSRRPIYFPMSFYSVTNTNCEQTCYETKRNAHVGIASCRSISRVISIQIRQSL